VSIGLFPVILYDYHRLHKCKRERKNGEKSGMDGGPRQKTLEDE
jgi:hypothetical protein